MSEIVTPVEKYGRIRYRVLIGRLGRGRRLAQLREAAQQIVAEAEV